MEPPQPERCDQAPPPAAASRARPDAGKDLELLRAWRDGDARAGTELLARCRGVLVATCLRHGIRGDAEIADVHQDVVLEILERLAELPETVERSFSGWFAWRVRRVIGRRRDPRGPETPIEREVQVEDDRIRADTWDAIRHCWQRLPPREREVFALRYLEGLSVPETAERLGSNANAVAQRIFQLIRRMRACLDHQGEGEPA